ncbi:NfrA family protein [Emcibacter sp.]|uniref:NfrA family protein n=1 Tax=Emcibacter sp. TaxID=1979954 RepID=UPI003A8D7F6A
MSTRLKYLALLTAAGSACILVFSFVWSSGFFRRERDWYYAYPYRIENRQSAQNTVFIPPVPVAIQQNISFSPGQDIKRADLLPQHGKSIEPMHTAPLPVPPDKKPLPSRPDMPEAFTNHIDPTSPPVLDWYVHAEKGYRFLAGGDHVRASEQFEKAIMLNPGHTDLKLQLAYSYLHLHQNKRAANWLAATIRDQAPDPSFSLRRQLEELNNRWSADSYLVYRDQKEDYGPLTGPNLVQSQAGAELAWQPPDIGYNNGRKLAIYGRLLWALEDKSLKFRDTSYQGGIGIRYKPLSRHNLVLSVERLLEVGSFARNDWMLRAGYSLDHRTDWQPEKAWWSGSLYLDTALIRPDDPDIFLTFQARGGHAIGLSENLVLRPDSVIHATWQKDRFREAHLVEGGPGLTLRYYFNDTPTEAWRSHLELSLDYRFRLAGNSLGKSGPVVSLLFHF